MPVLVDDTSWPLVAIKFPSSLNDEEMTVYIGELKRLRERREAYAFVIDTSGSALPTARQRKLQADSIAEGNPLARRYLRGIAFIVDSPIRRGILTAIFWLTKPDWRYQIFYDSGEAVTWARAVLAVPSSVPPGKCVFPSARPVDGPETSNP